MWDWFERSQRRERDLQQGVDADLVRDNRRRWKFAGALFGCAFAVIGIDAALHLPPAWHRVATWLFGILFVGSLLFAEWARAESAFLNKPDPKEPPRLWK